MRHSRPIKVLIVDDSALVRGLLTRILGSDRELEVVGTAADAYAAREKIKALEPQVLTLDIEMPRMDGLQFLRNLMRLRPMPVVMCSAMTERGAEATLTALALGAIDFVPKPKLDLVSGLEAYAAELIAKVKAAASARVQPIVNAFGEGDPVQPVNFARLSSRTRLIAIGASTGGTEAIRQVLMRLPVTSPPVVVAQHIPRAFSAQFARRLGASCALQVCEAEDGVLIQPGYVYVAPGDRHLKVVSDGGRHRCEVNAEPPRNHHRPSIDVLFDSVARSVGANAIGVILTGMGIDGASGLKRMREEGSYTIAQDERTSVVWGMPGAAVALGAVRRVAPLEEIAEELLGEAGDSGTVRPRAMGS